MPPRYAHKVDDNQADIVTFLRACGVKVAITSGLGGGFPDLVCGYQGQIVLLELKMPDNRHLTPSELDFHEEWERQPVYIVTNVAEAAKAVGVTYTGA